MTNNSRNRVVVFWLSQEEYRSLRDARNLALARNLSDLTCSEVFRCLNSDVPGEDLARRFATLEKQMPAMQFYEFERAYAEKL